MNRPHLLRRARRCRALVLAAAALACGPDVPSAPPIGDPRELLWAVVLDHHAITLAASGPQSSLRLAPVAINPAGEALAGTVITYSVTDSASVDVAADGTIRALKPATAVQLIATASAGNVTRRDTAFINIVDATPVPVLSTFTLALASGGLTVAAVDFFGLSGFDQAVATAADTGGAPLDGLPTYFSSSDPTTLTVDHVTGFVRGIRPGVVTLRATTLAFGIARRDSVTITVTSPQLGVVLGSPLAFDPGNLTVSVGGTVLFVNTSLTLPLDVVFDDPTNVAESPLFPSGSGNIEAFRADTLTGDTGFRFRVFSSPGTYTYHSTLHNTNGRIIVQ